MKFLFFLRLELDVYNISGSQRNEFTTSRTYVICCKSRVVWFTRYSTGQSNEMQGNSSKIPVQVWHICKEEMNKRRLATQALTKLVLRNDCSQSRTFSCNITTVLCGRFAHFSHKYFCVCSPQTAQLFDAKYCEMVLLFTGDEFRKYWNCFRGIWLNHPCRSAPIKLKQRLIGGMITFVM